MKIIKICWLFVITAITSSVHAEVYKCKLSDQKFVYKATPCSVGHDTENTIHILKPSAKEVSEALDKLQTMQLERQGRIEEKKTTGETARRTEANSKARAEEKKTQEEAERRTNTNVTKQ